MSIGIVSAIVYPHNYNLIWGGTRDVGECMTIVHYNNRKESDSKSSCEV